MDDCLLKDEPWLIVNDDLKLVWHSPQDTGWLDDSSGSWWGLTLMGAPPPVWMQFSSYGYSASHSFVCSLVVSASMLLHHGSVTASLFTCYLFLIYRDPHCPYWSGLSSWAVEKYHFFFVSWVFVVELATTVSPVCSFSWGCGINLTCLAHCLSALFYLATCSYSLV